MKMKKYKTQWLSLLLCAAILSGTAAGCQSAPAVKGEAQPPKEEQTIEGAQQEEEKPAAQQEPAGQEPEAPQQQEPLPAEKEDSTVAPEEQTEEQTPEEQPSPPPAEPPQETEQPPASEEIVEIDPLETKEPPNTGTGRTQQTVVLVPSATGEKTKSTAAAIVDYSNASEGYIMAKYKGSAKKVKLQLTGSNGVTYTYNLRKGGYETFPLTSGSGTYTVNILENVHSNQYAYVLQLSFKASISNSFSPYLYPNQYVNFNSKSTTVEKGAELAEGASTDLEVVQNVYNYVINNISYDYNKASTVKSGYLPDVDAILSSKTGICFDYAAVMATMLRTQNIPTRLEVGYVSGGIYHAWVSVYLSEAGWVNGIIQFDGKSWKLMDPTFASNGNSSSSIMQFIGNGTNYSLKYKY